MVQVYPFVSYFAGNPPRHTILRPRMLGKLRKHEILHRNQNIDLITKKFLKIMPAVSQRGAQLAAHLMLLPARVTGAEMVPGTQPHGIHVLSQLAANPPATLGNVLDGRVPVQVTGKQTGKASTVLLDPIEALALVLADPWRITDQCQGPVLCRKTAPPSKQD